ncbi:MAG: hypothetical protein K8J08_20845 [Thermoanaerobaculia bacterium]|nr:hypothetical protein [Thermoanaerobaculia bacterium]
MTRILSSALAKTLLALVLFTLVAGSASAGEHRIGFGMHYFKSLSDLESDDFSIDEDGLVPVFSYQYRPGGLVFFEADLEYFSNGFGGSEGTAYSPQILILVGRGFYGGVGVGFTIASDFEDNYSDAFYIARGGFSMPLLPRISLDINANYESGSFSTLDEFDSDTLTLGASIRVKF